VGAFVAGFFHVFTHAFFKACLFLGAGSVIHAMHSRIHDDDKAQDIRHMGGLSKYMPITFWTFAAATAAIVGFPLTSGFFSKDEILYKAFVSRPARPLSDAASEALPAFLRPWQFPEWLGPTLYWAAVAAATMTAFYMSRLFILTFLGDFRGWVVGRASSHGGASVAAHGAAEAGHDSHDSHEHHDDLTQPGPPPPESPWQMTIPLIVLGTASVVAGVLNAGLFHFEPLGHWLDPVFAEAVNNGVKERENAASLLWPLAAPGFLAFCVGSATAYWMYVMKRGEPAKQLADAQPALYRLVLDKWRIDELYQATVISAIDALADTAVAFDKYVVDGVLAKATAGAVAASGAVLRRLQSGVIHVYGAVMAAGIAGLAFFFGVPQPSMNVTEKDGDFVVTAGPGLSYSYRWDADGNGQVDEAEFGASRSVKLHLEPDAKQTVRVEVKNAFGVVASKEVEVHRPKPKEKDEPKPIKIGQR
jgi:NADH-quinone oxidoreductase subunit L